VPAGTPLPVGRVGRPHGLDGSFYVTRPNARLLTLGALVSVNGATAAIVRRSGTEQRPIVRLAGIENRAGAEQLRGAQLTVDSTRAPSLGEGEFWAHELVGCEVRDGDRVLGSVARLLELPSCEALEVQAPGGSMLLVPMVGDAVRSIDTAARTIDVDAGFLGLDAEPGAGAGGGTPPAGDGRGQAG